MEPFTHLTATAVPFDAVNVDTDQIIPSRLMRKPREDENYHTFLFHDIRYNEDGSEKPDFILNQAPYRDARILVAGHNFACGSSREVAVFALMANGFRAVIASSFGDIFFGNCFNNGVLPIRVAEETAARLRADLHASPGASMTIELEPQTITGADGARYEFDVDPFRKHCLLEGLDAIGLTLEYENEIKAFEDRYSQERSWLYP